VTGIKVIPPKTIVDAKPDPTRFCPDHLGLMVFFNGCVDVARWLLTNHVAMHKILTEINQSLFQ
jgi:hypothetical protein